MPFPRQKGGLNGTRNKLDITCNVFLLSAFLTGILLTATGCCAKIENQINFLNDDYSLQLKNNDASFSLSSDSQQTTMPHNNVYKNDLKRISSETIHRILRDENEPMSYRTNDLKFFRKRSSSTTEHRISKRSLNLMPEELPSPKTVLNLTDKNLHVFSQGVVNISRSLEEMTSIILHKNKLSEFPIRALPNLTLLDLSENNFSYFSLPEEYKNLRFINLNRNKIKNFTIEAPNSTQRNNTIRELHLKNNAIHWFGLINLGLLTELEVLDLSCNQLENSQTALFPDQMKNLKYLNLANNRLQCINREAFYNLISMNTLILSYNAIRKIDYETFLALPNLQYLDLSNNQLNGDSIRALQGIPDLVGLSIANNRELGDSMKEFVASWSLKELDASGTGLCKIPEVLAQSVRTLKLANNWLAIINCGDLDSYPLLQYLDLSYNQIDEIEEDAMGRLEILETLFLDHNNLKKIPISLPTTIEHLFLQNNQIMDVPLQSFQGLTNLKTLDLSSNKLFYLPDLPLPKLLTLNLQSSGINSLHHSIVQTSPHLRDLFLEDNPIKCADLLGITEWASPCRNDHKIAKRTNIKLFYVHTHNYFERFHCIGVDVKECASCFDRLDSIHQQNYTQNNCVDFNRTVKQKPLKLSTTESINLFTHDKTNLYKTEFVLSTTPVPENYNDESKSIQSSSKVPETNQNDLSKIHTNPQNLEGPASDVKKSKTNTDKKEHTHSTHKIPLLTDKKEKKLLELGNASFNLRHIKSDNIFIETSNNNSGNSLLNQNNTDAFGKGLLSQLRSAKLKESDFDKKKSTGNILAANKPNRPRLTVVKQQNKSTLVSNSTTQLKFPLTTTETIIIRNIPIEKESTELQHLQTQHSKDRHLIGTPLLMHKGHIVLIPQTLSASDTMLNSKDRNVSPTRIPESQTRRVSSKENKFKLIVGLQYPVYDPEKASTENTIIKPLSMNTTRNKSVLGQNIPREDVSQLIDKHQNKKKYKSTTATDKSNGGMDQKLREISNFLIQRTPKNKEFSNKVKVEKSKQNLTSHSLNTPSDIKIQSHGYNQLLEDFDDNIKSSNAKSEAYKHSRINKPLVKNQNDLQSQEILQDTFGNIIEGKTASASETKFQVISKSIATLSPQQENNIISQSWLDIRSEKRHQGLVVVISVTFAIIFFVGLFQVFRYQKKPIYQINQQNYVYKHHENYQSQYQYEKEPRFQNHVRRHHQHLQHHKLRMKAKPAKNSNWRCQYNLNKFSNYNCIEDLKLSKSMRKSSDVSNGPQSSKSNFNLESQKDECTLRISGNANVTTRNTRCTTHNYSLFQTNDKEIKNENILLEDRNYPYTEMNHAQNTFLANFLPMELLFPSRMPPLFSSSYPSPSAPMNIQLARSTSEHKHQQQKTNIDVDFQELNHKKSTEKLKRAFNIW